MNGVYWAAVVVTAVAGSTAAVAWDSWRRDRRVLAAFLIGLPLSPLVNEYVKTPIITGIEGLTWPAGSPIAPWSFLALVLWVAPFIEEATKMLPLAIPDIRESLSLPSMPLRYGMASGFGFGLGEAWYLAWGISHTQTYARLPFYYFTGYMSERLIVTFAHGVMASVAMTGIARGGISALGGYVGAAALHALLNVGALAYQARLIGAMGSNVAMLVSIVVLALVFRNIRSQTLKGEDPYGHR